MMVPVFFDVQRRKTKVWALLGWRATAVEVAYRVPPTVETIEALAGGRPAPAVLFSGDRYDLRARHGRGLRLETDGPRRVSQAL
jgi:hypothetical protein